jgi:PilZ domain
MRRLHQHQQVELHLDGEDQIVHCQIASVTGAVAMLHSTHQPTTLRDEPTAAALGYLLFQHHGNPIALRGIAATAPSQDPTLKFAVIDGVVLPERRAAERINLTARTRLAVRDQQADERAWIETATTNISLTGMLVKRAAGLGHASQFEIELFHHPQRAPLSCHARLARLTPTHIGITLADISEADRVVLAEIIRRHQRRS